MRTILFCIFICLFIAAQHCSAQQYFFSRYTPKNGLVNNRARWLYQDSKGRLYICTYGGLSVYDGARFLNYTTEDGLASGLVNDIIEMGEDSLWVIPNANALYCLVHGILRKVKTADDFYPVINQVIRASDGYLYAMSDEGFFRFSQNRFVRVPLTNSSGKELVSNLVRGVEWRGWLFMTSVPYPFGNRSHPPSLIVYNLSTHRYFLAGNSPDYLFPVITPMQDLLISTNEGVRKIDPEALQRNELHLLPPPYPYQAASALHSNYMYFDRSGNFWVGTGKAVTKIDKKGALLTFTARNGLPPGETNAILQDRENNMWFTSEENGIAKLTSQQAQFYTQPAPGFMVTDMSARNNSDSVWFYDDSKKSLLMLTDSTTKLFRGVGDLPTAKHILIGQKSYIIGAREIYALHFLPGQRFNVSLLYRDTMQIDGNAFLDSSGNLVLSYQKLTVLLDGKVVQRRLTLMADQTAMDKYGRLWVADRGNELRLYSMKGSSPDSPLQLLHQYVKDIPAISPRSVTVDGEGRVWIGTRDHGLYCFFFDGLKLLSWRQLTIEDGLSENFIEYLQCDADNTVWASMPSGVARIRFANGRFIIEDVIPFNDMYQRVYKTLSSSKGVHWALVNGGFLKFMSSGMEKNDYVPPILFSRILAGDEPLTDAGQGHLMLPYDRNTLSFYMGVPTFLDERLTRYTYLLEGSRSPKWSTPSTQSAIELVNLPPGKYTLRVKARFPTGRYPELSTSWSFVILPPWWQTWWFRIALAVVLTGLIVLWTRHYIRSKLELERAGLEKKQAVEKERTRIATDMHDDLGAGLSRIKFLSDTIHLKKQLGHPAHEDIGSIGHYANEMIDKLGEIVWALNEKNDSLSDLLSYTRSYASEYLIQSGLQCSVESPVNVPLCFLHGDLRRNIYLTIKEALHNIVKHARARNVIIRMVAGEYLTITIEDDGVGFDPCDIRPFSNGLTNMQQRIRDIGGRLEVSRNAGTTICLSVRLPAI